MSLKKNLKSSLGQSLIEYILLVVITLTALLTASFIIGPRNGTFDNHFQQLGYWIGGVNLQ